jgi:2-polyprenyl-3-methyl-5-hydroxy-6-metoxy-1,4-benzoquinol methylase
MTTNPGGTTVATPADQTHSSEQEAEQRDALVERLFEAVLSFNDLHMVYVGDRLGLYRALADGGPTTSVELAQATGTHERYVREWLEHQAVGGLLEVDDASLEAKARRYRLPTGHVEVLLERDSLNYLAPFVRMMVGLARPLPAVLEAFRSGGGVPYIDFTYDADFCEGQEDMNRVQYVNLLGSKWLPALPDVHARLRQDPPARVVDVACGTGWSSIAIARAYPKVRVDGFDLDEPSITRAKRNAAETGLEDRVSFEVRDAADLDGRYDLVTVFEAIHDMSRPVEVLTAIRDLVADGGAVIIADERVAESFTAPGDEVERLMYGWSVLHCLPVGMADQPSAGTGTAMRPATLREYALAAGFHDVEVLAIENDFWRFYRLRS